MLTAAVIGNAEGAFWSKVFLTQTSKIKILN